MVRYTRRRCDMGLAGMALSAIAAAAGAIMYWAVTYQGHGFRLSTVGLILMIAGAAGFVVSTIVFAVSRREVGTGTHSMDRQVTDSQGGSSSVHEERKYRILAHVEFTLRTSRVPHRKGPGSSAAEVDGLFSIITTKKDGASWQEKLRSRRARLKKQSEALLATRSWNPRARSTVALARPRRRLAV